MPVTFKVQRQRSSSAPALARILASLWAQAWRGNALAIFNSTSPARRRAHGRRALTAQRNLAEAERGFARRSSADGRIGSGATLT